MCRASAPEERTRLAEQQMTGDERFGLIHSYVVFAFGGKRDPRVPKTRAADSGLVAAHFARRAHGLLLTDAGQGIAGQPAAAAALRAN